MLLLQLMTKFPGTATLIEEQAPDAWYIGTILGPIQPGMGQWLSDRNVRIKPSNDRTVAYHLLWKSDPDQVNRAFTKLLALARKELQRGAGGVNAGRVVGQCSDMLEEANLL
jgi:hypothetical protein